MVNKCLIAFVAAKIVQRDSVNVRAQTLLRVGLATYMAVQGVALYQLSELAQNDRPQ